MPAIRIIDDHVELANIGTNTHAQIDSHIADPSAHHTKYTDAEAVSAVAVADDYVKNTGDTITGILKSSSTIRICDPTYVDYLAYQFLIRGANAGLFLIRDNSTPFIRLSYYNTTTDAQFGGQMRGLYSYKDGLNFTDLSGSTSYLRLYDTYVNIMNRVLKDPKNHAASALSGTKKLVEIDIGGASYYFEVYPTKA